MPVDTRQKVEGYPYWAHPKLEAHGSACLFTSGSTSEPKVVVYSWEALLRQASETLQRSPYLTRQDSGLPFQLVAASSIAHAYAINAVFTCHLGSVPLGLLAGPPCETAQYFRDTSQTHLTAILGTPSFYQRLLDDPQVQPADLRRVRYPYSAGCALPAETWSRMKERFAVNIMQNFGTSETGNVAVFEQPEQTYTEGFVGLPWGEVKLLALKDRKISGGWEGEILVKVPWMSLGYVSCKRLLAHRDYHPTGDLGKLLALSGQPEKTGLVVGPRIRPLIVYPNSTFDPLEAEALMKHHEEIDNCVVIQGEENTQFGAFVVLKLNSSSNRDSLLTWWNEHCVEHLLPQMHNLKICCTLPTSPAGKVVYKQLTWKALVQ